MWVMKFGSDDEGIPKEGSIKFESDDEGILREGSIKFESDDDLKEGSIKFESDDDLKEGSIKFESDDEGLLKEGSIKFESDDDLKEGSIKFESDDEGILKEDLMNVLRSVAASNYGDAIERRAMNVLQLSGAMTNKVYRISWPTAGGSDIRNVLVRVYGKGVDLFFNRDEEIRTFENISKLGYGPQLLQQFEGGRVEHFIYAKTLEAADLRDPDTSALIAAAMKEFHELDMPGSKEPILWSRLRNWLVVAKKICTRDHAKEFQLNSLEQEITFLEGAISMDHQQIAFCHNDLQYGNIMVDKDGDITIIDYEYASYNPVAYDIANHFCEMAANYHTVTPHILDYSKYPTVKERKRFIQKYLSSSGNETIETAEEDQHAVDQHAVDQLADDVERYTLANHIFWGLWGLISSYVNQIDFDYKEYARQRFEQYWLRKAAILNVQGHDNEDSTK